MILFNIPPYVGKEEVYIKEVIQSHRLSGDGQFTKLCNSWMENRYRRHRFWCEFTFLCCDKLLGFNYTKCYRKKFCIFTSQSNR